ncbi:MAG: UDP-N-acetylmuramoyl-tripeptide--D-alanyl-D-alanine ligase [Clostridia bacterium]|nr:UDP-N-acetylmuramoyl-tripeptide--D-alanyl-D-alanine ligase [Clostridia bacterium]
MIFFDWSNPHLWIAMALSLLNAILLCFEGYKFLQIIQLSGYHLRGYFDWLKDTRGKYVVRLLVLSLLSLACLLVTNAIFRVYVDYLSYLGLVLYFLLSIYMVLKIYHAPKKTPLKMTNRMNRSVFVLFLLNLIVSFGFIALSSVFIPSLRFSIVALTPLTLIITVPFAHWMLKPIENAINRGYIFRAKNELKSYPQLIKIGITGSYGKTSVKNYLTAILSERYSVCATPLNFNTPTGISKTVLEYLSPSHQVLIAEMGARKVGEIKELCDMVEPQFGIVTAVGEQHLATFYSLENIKRTKSEPPLSLGENGYCVFDGDNENSLSIYQKSICQKAQVSLTNKDAQCYATDIKQTENGINFTAHIKGLGEIKCETKLFGEHNITNILLAIMLAYKLGLKKEEIARGVGRILPVEHRLQLIKSNNDVLILDDTYNASIEGSQRALKVLSTFDNRRKIVVTPGLVELGTMERVANYDLGKHIAKVANLVIIVNKTHYLSIKQGLLDAGFDEQNILQADSIDTTKQLLSENIKPKDIVLWENDLPDNYR